MKVVLVMLSCAFAAINYKMPMSEFDLDLTSAFPSAYEATGTAIILA
jgi:hypothetical protein